MNLAQQQQLREHLDRAKLEFEAGLYGAALLGVKDALALDAGHLEARMLEARIQLHMQRPHLTLRALDRRVPHAAITPAPPDDHTDGDTDAQASGMVPDTTTADDTADTHDAMTAPEAMMLRAQAMLRMADHQGAIEILTTMSQTYADDARVHRLMVTACAKAGDNLRARQHLETILRLSPSDQAARRMLARLLSDDDPQAAAEVLMADPAHHLPASVKLWVARLLRRVERMRDADEMLREVEMTEVGDNQVRYELGTLADERGDDATACSRLSLALRLAEPEEYTRLARTLARVHMHAGRFGEAAVLWWRITRRQPRDYVAWSGLAASAQLAGRMKLSQRALREVRQSARRTLAQRLIAAAWTHAACGISIAPALLDNIDAATADASENPTPSMDPLRSLLAGARETLESIAAQRPHHADVQHHLSLCLDALGDTAGAHRANHAALAINPRYAAALAVAERLAA